MSPQFAGTAITAESAGPAHALPTSELGDQAEPAEAWVVRRSTRGDLMALSHTMTSEFSGRVAAGTVIRVVVEARELLLAAGLRQGLVVAVESMARARLGRLASRPTSRTATR